MVRKAGDIIFELLQERFGAEFVQNAHSTARLFSAWGELVAEVWQSRLEDTNAVCAHSQITELENGTLLVQADHPGWIQILKTKQAQILTAAQRRYPDLDIKEISFRLSREPFEGRE